jgi:hypothetical protein
LCLFMAVGDADGIGGDPGKQLRRFGSACQGTI